jgi:hypothetical protein
MVYGSWKKSRIEIKPDKHLLVVTKDPQISDSDRCMLAPFQQHEWYFSDHFISTFWMDVSRHRWFSFLLFSIV